MDNLLKSAFNRIWIERNYPCRGFIKYNRRAAQPPFIHPLWKIEIITTQKYTLNPISHMGSNIRQFLQSLNPGPLMPAPITTSHFTITLNPPPISLLYPGHLTLATNQVTGIKVT